MAFISVTFSFSNASKIISANINQNYTDMINGITDGTKDLKMYDIEALTLSAGRAIVKGALSLSALTILSPTGAKFDGDVDVTESLTLDTFAMGTTGTAALTATKDLALTKSKMEVSATDYNNGDTNAITVDATNNKFEVTEVGETTAETITLSNGSYTGATMAAEIQSKMNAALTQTYVCTYSGGANGKYTISSSGNPFILWVTGGTAMVANILPDLGFLLGGTIGVNTLSDTHTSDVAYKIGYYNTINTFTAVDDFDGELCMVSLQPYSTSGSYVPVIVTAFNTDIALTKNSKLLIQNVKKYVAGGPGLRLLGFSSNFVDTMY